MGAVDISISELRQNLAEYLRRVKRGETLRVTQHGTVVARLEPALSEKEAAKARMDKISKSARIGDVVSPIDVEWNAVKGVAIGKAPRKRRTQGRRRS